MPSQDQAAPSIDPVPMTRKRDDAGSQLPISSRSRRASRRRGTVSSPSTQTSSASAAARER